MSGLGDAASGASFKDELVCLVTRALEPVGAADDASLMVHMALAEVSEDFDPSDLVQLNLFILGALADVIEGALEPAAAESAIERLRLACEPTVASEDSAGSATAAGAGRAAAGTTSKTIMLLTNNKALLDAIAGALQSSRFELVSSPDPATCVVHCAAVRPALVICDDDVLEVDHSKFLRLLGRSMGGNAPPVLLLASAPVASGPELVAVALKPIDAAALLPTIEQLAVVRHWLV